jgi:hypothetical protein
MGQRTEANTYYDGKVDLAFGFGFVYVSDTRAPQSQIQPITIAAEDAHVRILHNPLVEVAAADVRVYSATVLFRTTVRCG